MNSSLYYFEVRTFPHVIKGEFGIRGRHAKNFSELNTDFAAYLPITVSII
jgi:hypothetical protein